ncbi:hypothetical protein NX862_18975 [Rhodobacter sp. KR11]|uniref:hypothetical protein n=1 Tax=Rhodobacter sp. KR11 TaxID=2974588 RepID=UPI002222EA7A|nr:hypothetical protein [Rhodobacter sp. KR11]MCW1920847.1 hypothetical protein [Rhodobacter sp. KR11]
MVKPRRLSRRHPAFVRYEDHQKLWALVEGAVADALRTHPDYLTARGAQLAAGSITKRVVGQLVGHAKETLAGGRLGDRRPEGAFQDADGNPSLHQGEGEAGRVDSPARPDDPAPFTPFFSPFDTEASA